MVIYAITWNIKSGRKPDGCYPFNKNENLNRIAEAIKNSGASIACLQEVDCHTLRSGCINQAKFITKRLTELTHSNWHYEYIASIKAIFGSYGNAVISRYPLTTVLKIPLAKKNGLENRSFILTRVDCGSDILYAGTFHLGLRGDQPMQARKIKEALYISGYKNEKLIIGGDLNQREGSSSYNIMMHDAFPMVDAGPFGVGTLQCGDNTKNVRADFWFSRGVLTDLSKNRVLNIDISDHRPVVVCISTN